MFRFLVLIALMAPGLIRAEALPSWHEGGARDAILAFVDDVTNPRSEHFVPSEERVAVFDNDGTLWSEKPVYFQLLFAMDRVKALAPQNPAWRGTAPFKAVLDGDMDALTATGERGLLELILATHAGMTTVEFEQVVRDWLAEARHPRFDRPFTELVYQPMLELLTFLRKNGFKTFIVSGGGLEFMRPWTQAVYGIPPEQVIGSTIAVEFVLRDGVPTLVRLPEIDFIDDKAGKPVAIHKFIGRRPIFAAGNSDGDLQMLQWSTAGTGRSLGVIVRHTDAEREWAYDRDSAVGRLDKALDLAPASDWLVIDMKADWRRVYASP